MAGRRLKTKDILLEAGIIPEGAVKQLEGWRSLTPEEAARAGSRPVSQESDSEAAARAKKARFVQDLQKSLDSEDSTVRLTQLGGAVGEEVNVWITWAAGSVEAAPVKAVKDKAGNIHLPVSAFQNGRARKVGFISYTPGKGAAKKVVHTETYYKDDKPVSVMCVLED